MVRVMGYSIVAEHNPSNIKQVGLVCENFQYKLTFVDTLIVGSLKFLLGTLN